jgi:hypothetical protein
VHYFGTLVVFFGLAAAIELVFHGDAWFPWVVVAALALLYGVCTRAEGAARRPPPAGPRRRRGRTGDLR